MNREQKQQQIDRIRQQTEKSQAVLLVNPIGLTVEQVTDLRVRLKQKDALMEVVKNTLTRRAGEGQDLARLEGLLKGPNALVYSFGDPVTVAKVLVEYAKANPKMALKGGLLSGKLLSSDQVETLAKMPGREQLLAQVAGQMQSLIAGLPRAMGALLRGFPNAIQAIISKKQEAAA